MDVQHPAAKRLRNKSASRLPAEILGEIASFVAEPDPPVMPAHYPPAPYPDRTLGWINMGQVCSSWRDCIMATKLLWADSIGVIPSDSAIYEMLSRAGPSASITLHLREHDGAYKLLEDVAVRTRISCIIMDSNDDLPLVPSSHISLLCKSTSSIFHSCIPSSFLDLGATNAPLTHYLSATFS
jgi:hypothetical protein